MTNLNKLYDYYDVHTHNQEMVKELLTVHLPKSYTSEVQEILKNKRPGVSSQTIRQVKCGLYKDVFIYAAIIEVANKYKKASQKLSSLLQSTEDITND